MKTRTLLASFALASFAFAAAEAQQRPDYGLAIEIDVAKRIAEGVLEECRNNNWNVAVAVVDNHGFLIYFERMPNTQTASVDIAVGKAKTAAMYRRTTRVFMEAINSGPATATLGGIYASPGGMPIFADDTVIGGVGVSGFTGDQDEQCAEAGLAGL
jgi:glc operon protein GlcG